MTAELHCKEDNSPDNIYFELVSLSYEEVAARYHANQGIDHDALRKENRFKAQFNNTHFEY